MESQPTIITSDLITKALVKKSTFHYSVTNLKKTIQQQQQQQQQKDKNYKLNTNNTNKNNDDTNNTIKYKNNKRKLDPSLSTVVRKRLCPSPPYTNDDTRPPTSKSNQSIDAILH